MLIFPITAYGKNTNFIVTVVVSTPSRCSSDLLYHVNDQDVGRDTCRNVLWTYIVRS